MNSYCARGVLFALGLCCLSGTAWGQGFGSPSLLESPGEPVYPITQPNYPISQVGYRNMGDDTLVSPSDNSMQPAPAAQPYAAPTPMAGEYQRAMSQDWGDSHAASCNSCTSGTCDAGDCYHGGCRRGAWFGYAGGLVMTRANCASVPLAYNTLSGMTNLATSQADFSTIGGFEASIGKWFCGCNVGVEAVYWGLFPGQSTYSVTGSPAAGYTSSWQMYNGIAYNNPVNGVVPYGNYYSNAVLQTLQRDFDIQNVEVNLIGNAWTLGGCGSCNQGYCGGGCGAGYAPLSVGWLAGFRYFGFQDNLLWQSDNGNGIINGGNDEASYLNQIQNNLFGFQMGGYLNYQIGCRWSVYGGAKAGVFDNHITSYKRLYGPAGDAYINNGGPYQGQALSYRSAYDNLALMAQLDVGTRCQLSCNWAIRAGYRVVGVGGVATTENQFQQNYNDYGGFQNINCSGSLMLHGAYAGAEFCW